MQAFIFDNKAAITAPHQAKLPLGLKNKDALLDAIAAELRFPDYFGRNWDALDECITDLSWLPPGDVALIHRDLPLSDNRASLSIYLSILRKAVRNWDREGSNLIYASPARWDTSDGRELLVKRNLFVVFPSSAEITVRNLLDDEF